MIAPTSRGADPHEQNRGPRIYPVDPWWSCGKLCLGVSPAVAICGCPPGTPLFMELLGASRPALRETKEVRKVLECGSPLPLWESTGFRKRQRTAALQNARAPRSVHGPNARPWAMEASQEPDASRRTTDNHTRASAFGENVSQSGAFTACTVYKMNGPVNPACGHPAARTSTPRRNLVTWSSS
jgi:hypothetical protein